MPASTCRIWRTLQTMPSRPQMRRHPSRRPPHRLMTRPGWAPQCRGPQKKIGAHAACPSRPWRRHAPDLPRSRVWSPQVAKRQGRRVHHRLPRQCEQAPRPHSRYLSTGHARGPLRWRLQPPPPLLRPRCLHPIRRLRHPRRHPVIARARVHQALRSPGREHQRRNKPRLPQTLRYHWSNPSTSNQRHWREVPNQGRGDRSRISI